jgi:hypothetical protein
MAITISGDSPNFANVAITTGTITTGTITTGTITTLNAPTGVLATQNGMTGIPKAWVKFVGSTGAISSSFNVSSVTRGSTGHYTINFTTALANANYAVGGMVFNQTSGNGTRSLASEGTPTTSALQVFNMTFNGSQEDANASVIVCGS